MANKRDYYEVLGVQKNATDEEIKRAYRRKAKECHPDLHPDDKTAEDRFKELNEANEVLSDPDKRARYDQFGFNDPAQGFGGGAGGFDPFGGMGGFGDIFDQLFGGMGGGSRRNPNAPRQGNDLRYELRISFEEAAFGCEKSFDFPRNENCDTCHGTGCKPGTQPKTCPTCKGAGQVRVSGGFMTTVRTCSTCGGTGKIVADKCTSCAGTGRIRRKRTANPVIPAGADDGQTFVMRGVGEPGINGGPAGDLNITIRVRPHKVFRREGTMLHLDVPVSFTQAALGAELELPELGGGKYTFKIPEGTQEGTEFRVRGKGVPILRGSGRGDMILHVHIDIPRHLSEKQKELLRQFDDASTGREYDKRRGFLDKIKDLFN